MVTSVLACLLGLTPTWDDVERYKYEEYRKLTGFRETLKLGDATIEKKISKQRLWMRLSNKGVPGWELGNDGKTAFVIMYSNKEYTQFPGDDDPAKYKEPFVPQKEDGEPGDFKVNFEGYGLQISCFPKPTVKSVELLKENGKELRYVRANVVSPKSGNSLIIEQAFLPDKWILTKLIIRSIESGKESEFMRFEAVSQKFDCKFTDKDFQLDQTKVKGFTRTGG